MSLSNSLESLARPSIPKEWQQRRVWDGNKGEVVTGLIEPVEEFTSLLERFGWNPETVEIDGTVNAWYKEQPWPKDEEGNEVIEGERPNLVSYFFKVRTRETSLDLPALYAASRQEDLPPVQPYDPDRTTVVAFADAQIGKKASRGGTPELIERLKEKRAKLDAHLGRVLPQSLVLAEVGDLFEGFESGGNPMFLNDLSLHQQMDMASTEMVEFLRIMRRYGHVDVMCVPSNHTQWRNGKQQLGHPGDDLGLLVHKQVEKIAVEAAWDASWHFPGFYEEAVTLDVRGTVLGLVHGNQYPAAGAVKWWAGQQHGGQPIGAADILLAGHYHHLKLFPTGRNPYTGRTKWFIQAPTLDNGSDWFRNMTGDDSDPGLLVFDITEEGFDLQSLTVL